MADEDDKISKFPVQRTASWRRMIDASARRDERRLARMREACGGGEPEPWDNVAELVALELAFEDLERIERSLFGPPETPTDAHIEMMRTLAKEEGLSLDEPIHQLAIRVRLKHAKRYVADVALKLAREVE